MRQLILLAALGLALPASAQVQEQTVTWYDVELIVFRHVDARTSETWPADAGVPEVTGARSLFPTEDIDASPASVELAALEPETPIPYVPLDASEHHLTGIHDSLRRSSRYEPLLHVAWTQPPLDRNQSPYLRVHLPVDTAEEVPQEQEPLLGDESDTYYSDESLQEEQPLPEFLADDEQPSFLRPLDGRIQLSVNRYLHLDLDLLYLPEELDVSVLRDLPAATEEWTEQQRLERERRHREIIEALARGDISLEEAEILSLEPEQEVFQGFRLNQYRRLRTREVHYFDHPVYGVIVTVTPREVPARTLGM